MLTLSDGRSHRFLGAEMRKDNRQSLKKKKWWWNPWLLAATCIILLVISTAILSIDENGNATRAVFTALAVASFLLSLAGLVDMTRLCFVVGKTDDDRLNLSMILAIPIARTVSWAHVHMASWTWDEDGWTNHLLGISAFEAMGQFVFGCANFVPSYDASSLVTHVLSGLFVYENYVILIPVIIGACISLVVEHAKTTNHADDRK